MALLQAINSGRVPRFADGGLVTPVSVPPVRMLGASAGVTVAPVIHTTVNASGGTPEQNADLANQTSKRIETAVRSLVVDEMMPADAIGEYAFVAIWALKFRQSKR